MKGAVWRRERGIRGSPEPVEHQPGHCPDSMRDSVDRSETLGQESWRKPYFSIFR